jgi:agmatinase
MLHIAHEEGLLSNHSNMHLGSRCTLFDEHYDLNNDLRCGFSYIRAGELDKLGVDKVVKRIVETVGDEYVYLSADIDVLDVSNTGSLFMCSPIKLSFMLCTPFFSILFKEGI